MTKRNTALAIAVASALASATAVAGNSAGVDTSEWLCESCPFQTDYEAEAEIGALFVDEDSAKFGEYNGLDEKAAYADLSAHGGSRSESGTYYRYELNDLGRDTRDAALVVGREGMLEGTLSYDELPHRVWDTTVTPYRRSGKDALALPAGWVRSGSTAGMAALDDSLDDVRVGTERTTMGAGLDYLFGSNLKFFADYSRQEIEGNRLATSNFLFQALQYAEPVDATHDQFEVGATYRWNGGFARVTWYGSTYDNALASVSFDNPYLPAAPDTTLGRKAASPDNKAHTYALDGNFVLPWWNAALSYRLAEGTMEQAEDFLPFSTSPLLSAGSALPRAQLDGDVSTSHYRAVLSARPLSRLRARLGYRYDERDDSTPGFTVARYVESDSAVNGPATRSRYGYERTRVDGNAELRATDWLSVGIGAGSDKVERSGQATDQTRDDRSYVELRLRPWGSIELTARYGQSDVRAGEYEVMSGPLPENPLLRKFNQTDRDRDFAEGRLGWSQGKVALSLEGSYAFDDYTRSLYGLNSSRDYRYGGTVSWAVTDDVSLYATGSYQDVLTKQSGEQAFPGVTRPWQAVHEDEFAMGGGGVVWRKVAGSKVDLTVDYTYGRSEGAINTAVGGSPDAGGPFPNLETELNSLRLRASYDVSERLRVGVAWTWEDYDSTDWQLGGVEPATVPNLLGMSPDPYKYSVNLIGVSFSYRFGGGSGEEEAAE